MFSKIHEKAVDFAYKVYVTESLRLQGESKYIGQSFKDIVNPPEEVDAEKLVEDFIKKSGIKLE